MITPSKSATAIRVIQAARQSFAGCQSHGCACPSHQIQSSSNAAITSTTPQYSPSDIRSAARSILSQGRARSLVTPSHALTEYAFEVSAAQLSPFHPLDHPHHHHRTHSSLCSLQFCLFVCLVGFGEGVTRVSKTIFLKKKIIIGRDTK
jgi:hypothetical protein